MKDETENKPRVGIGVMVFKNGKILLGLRKGRFGNGEWHFPGGHLEYMESFETCARRETLEEAGIELENIRWCYLGNINIYAPRHYVQIGMIADWKSGEPKVMEPEKCSQWKWFSLDALPSPLFQGSEIVLRAFQNGIQYRDLEK